MTYPINQLGYSYSSSWFAGVQAKLYIGDIFLDEIVAVDYKNSTQKVPIYGYASKLYDTIASGRSLVMGTFAINFKYNGWLTLILKHLQEQSVDISKLEEEAIENWASHRIDRIRTAEQNKDTIAQTSFAFDLIGEISSTPSDAGEIFKQKVEALRKQIWGDNTPKEFNPSEFAPFDISIHYGTPIPTSGLGGRPVDSNYTAKRIVGVSITSDGQAINLSGDNIIEVYEFIARTVL